MALSRTFVQGCQTNNGGRPRDHPLGACTGWLRQETRVSPGYNVSAKKRPAGAGLAQKGFLAGGRGSNVTVARDNSVMAPLRPYF
jgi:hypothetical protein